MSAPPARPGLLASMLHTGRGRSCGFPLGVLVVVYLSTIFAGFFAPHDPALQDRDLPYAPPTRLHVVDSSGRLHLRPFVYGLAHPSAAFAEYTEDRSRAYPVRFDRSFG